MATVETHWFTKGGKNLVEQEIGWVTGPINVMLLTGGIAWAGLDDAWETYADAAPSEAPAGNGYALGGVVLGTRSVVIDAPSNETRLLGADVSWPASTIVSAGAVIYANVGTKPLLGFVNFEQDRFTNIGTFLIEWPDTGVLRMAAI